MQMINALFKTQHKKIILFRKD